MFIGASLVIGSGEFTKKQSQVVDDVFRAEDGLQVQPSPRVNPLVKDGKLEESPLNVMVLICFNMGKSKNQWDIQNELNEESKFYCSLHGLMLPFASVWYFTTLTLPRKLKHFCVLWTMSHCSSKSCTMLGPMLGPIKQQCSRTRPTQSVRVIGMYTYNECVYI